MNTGVQRAPDEAAQSLRIVRLVSFAASAALAGLLALTIASLRYAPFGDDADPPSVAVLGDIQRPPSPPEALAPRRPLIDRTDRDSAVASSPPLQQETASEPVVITQPVWLERPRNLARFYPREAFMRGLNGQVVLDCIVETTGRLSCTIASEAPEAQGFGAAALAIAAEHLMRPATENGAPVRGRYRMTVPFTAG